MTRGVLAATAVAVVLAACSSGAAENVRITTPTVAAITEPANAVSTVPAECRSALNRHDDLAADLAAALNRYVASIDAGQYSALERRYDTVMSRFRQTEAQWTDVVEDCPRSQWAAARERWRAASQKIYELRAVCRAGPGPDLGWNC